MNRNKARILAAAAVLAGTSMVGIVYGAPAHACAGVSLCNSQANPEDYGVESVPSEVPEELPVTEDNDAMLCESEYADPDHCPAEYVNPGPEAPRYGMYMEIM